MIEQALYEHFQGQDILSSYLAVYGGKMAIFSQEAPNDKDSNWESDSQYGRIVFLVDLQGDPARTLGGTLTVDIQCEEGKQFPEDIEPIVRHLIHGYFFCQNTFSVSAQWRDSSYFTEVTKHVTGCTMTFALLAFPISTYAPGVIAQFNEWSSTIENLHVINHDPLPSGAWKPSDGQTAIYWRVAKEEQCPWIRSTATTVWQSATVKGYIFSETPALAAEVANHLKIRLYTDKRLKKNGELLRAGESPIMVNHKITVDNGADPLKVGQLTVEATYGVVVHYEPDPEKDGAIQNIKYK